MYFEDHRLIALMPINNAVPQWAFLTETLFLLLNEHWLHFFPHSRRLNRRWDKKWPLLWNQAASSKLSFADCAWDRRERIEDYVQHEPAFLIFRFQFLKLLLGFIKRNRTSPCLMVRAHLPLRGRNKWPLKREAIRSFKRELIGRLNTVLIGVKNGAFTGNR